MTAFTLSYHLQSFYPVRANEFRILFLEGYFSRSDPIRATLSVYPIDDSVPYAALSYVWGNPEPVHTIEIDPIGQIGVSENLYQALLRARPPGGPKNITPIWIDAICIDQQSAEEKS